MRKRASFDGATGVRHQQLRRRPALLGGATRVGNFDERQWGISASAVNRPRCRRPMDPRMVGLARPYLRHRRARRTVPGDQGLRTALLSNQSHRDAYLHMSNFNDWFVDVERTICCGPGTSESPALMAGCE